MERMDGRSMDATAENIDKLKELFPEVLTEGKIDLDKLLAVLGNDVSDDFEKYEFRWKGKMESLKLAGLRSTGTLLPCKEESKDWNTTQNLYIEGDNLEVLKLLQQGYHGKIKMIYIDPPYNTGHDFVYKDSFSDNISNYKEMTEQTGKSNPETSGRYHTNWLNMIYPRLLVAKTLLRDDGVIFISIDDSEQANLKKLCDEVFGEDNFVAALVYDKNRKNDAKFFSVGHEYMLVYFKNSHFLKDNNTIFRIQKEGVDEVKIEFEKLRKKFNDDWEKVNEGLKKLYETWPKDDERRSLARFTKVDEKGPYRDDGNISWPGGGGPKYEVLHPVTKRACKVPDAGWRFTNFERMKEEIEVGRVVFGNDETTLPRIRRNLFDVDSEVMRSVHFSYAQTATVEFHKIFDNLRIFQNPKHFEDIKKLIQYITTINDNDIILDFFSGSSTTAHAVMKLNAEDGGNRKFIMVQLPEKTDEKSEAYQAGYKNICEIGKERIRRAGEKILTELNKSTPAWMSALNENAVIPHENRHCGLDPQSISDRFRLKAGMTEGSHTMINNILDIGFKVFKLDSSNIKRWDSSPLGDDPHKVDTILNRLNSMVDTIRPDRTKLDVVYEVMLKFGIDLNISVTKLEFAKPSGSDTAKQAYAVGEEPLFLVCLEPDISIEIVEAMADSGTGTIVFAEECFKSDTAITNAELILKDRDIDIRVI